MANKLISIVPSGTNNYLTPSLSLNRLATDSVSPGVVGAVSNTSGVAPATGAFAVNAQGSPNMTVAVTGGVAYLSATPTGGTAQTFAVTMDAAENVTIASNSSGSTVYDFIYLQADATALNNPSSTALNVVTLITSRSTTAYSAGGANFGNSNGAIANSLLIAVVTVANGAASIANASITDARLSAIDLLTSTLGYAQVTANFSTASTTAVLVSGLTTTVNVSAGARRVKISCFVSGFSNSTTGMFARLQIWKGTVGSGTLLNQNDCGSLAGEQNGGTIVAVDTPAAGSVTYNIGMVSPITGTVTFIAGATYPAFILVEAI